MLRILDLNGKLNTVKLFVQHSKILNFSLLHEGILDKRYFGIKWKALKNITNFC